MKIETMKYLISLKRKENLINEENAFLEIYKVLSIISDILVDESKQHLTSSRAVDIIRETMDDINYI